MSFQETLSHFFEIWKKRKNTLFSNTGHSVSQNDTNVDQYNFDARIDRFW